MSDEVLFKAQLSRFYGWTDRDIKAMSYKTALEYFEAIPVIDARERVEMLQVSAYPHLDESNRAKLFEKVKIKAYPPEEISTKQLFERLKNGG